MADDEGRKLFEESKLEQSVLAAVETWRFTPALFDDRPVCVDFRWKIAFKPDEHARPSTEKLQFR